MDTAASSQFTFHDVSTTDAFAIPIGTAQTIVDAISSGKASATVHIGTTAFLGIESASPDVSGLGYGGQAATSSGALIVSVVSGGPAASARPCGRRRDHSNQRPERLVADGAHLAPAHEETRREGQGRVRRPVRHESHGGRQAR